MAPREASEPGSESQTYRPNLERGQHVLDLLEDPQNPENLKELKGMMGNRSWEDFLGVLKDTHLAHENVKEQLQRASATVELEPQKRKKFPDPEKFVNDGNPIWEDWYVDMTVKLRSETTWDKEDKKGYVLGRTGKDPRKLIQPGYIQDEYNTVEEMLQVLSNAYNDPHKKAKARAMYRNLKMGENERFDTFMSKFTACAAQAGITDNTMMREDLFDKVTKPLRDTMRPTLSLYPTFTDFREQLSLLYWELEAEKKRSPRTTTEKPTSPSTRKPNPRTTTNTTAKEEKGKERPKYNDKRKAELSLKGACFNCEQTGYIAKDCPKKDSIKVLKANEETSSESGKEDP
jgi:hypothetical protein